MKDYPYRLFYKPKGAAAADFIPFHHDGKFRLFYLHDWRDPAKHGEGTPWYLIETDDFVRFEERGEVIARGAPDEPDLFIFTGSVIRALGRFHIFYTAHNHHMAERGRPVEQIAHAVSDDLVHWEKRPQDSFSAASGFDPDNLRDPFVFYDSGAKLYRMACVKRRAGGAYTSGFTAQYVSDDLLSWREAEDIWSPQLFHTHECPDLFQIGDWWYLIYSEYSDRNQTRYVMSKSLTGPWLMPADDSFDGRAFYAAKSWSDGRGRFLFGWIPTRDGDRDDRGWNWGGNLAVTELWQRPDGTLACRMPGSAGRAWTRLRTEAPQKAERADGLDDRLLFTAPSSTFRFDASLSFGRGTHAFGLVVGQDFASKQGYRFEFLPAEGRVRFGRTDRCIHTQGLARPLAMAPDQRLSVKLVVDCDICVIYINDETVLSARMCDVAGSDVSLYTVGGFAEAEDLALYTL